MVLYEAFRTRPLSDFHAELSFEFPTLPEALFDYYLIRTAIDMAKRGNLIRRRAVLTAQHGVTRYRLVSPDQFELLHIMNIRREPHCACMSENLPRSFCPPATAERCGRDIAWYDEQEQVLHINPPYCHGDYYVEMSVTPPAEPCELPAEFLDKYQPTLLMGTKAAILMITGRPWTNVQVGAALRNEYLRAVAADAVDTMSHRMRGGVKMQFGKVL